ncbi:MAG TPA: hypothetical protein VHU40_03120, partial [Polyangia bacterium]|nr:hypothetical protein [Polyangia bacterium]
MNRVFDVRGPVPVILLSAVAAALAFACKPHTRDNPDVCLPGPNSTDPCPGNLVCNERFHCVDPLAGTGGAGGTGETGTGGTVDGSGGIAAGGKGSGGAAAGGKAGVSGSGGKAGGAGGTLVECTETGTKNCPVGKVCLAGACVECKGDNDCTTLTTPSCSSDHKCVSCMQAGVNACASHKDKTACATSGTLAGACVQCDKHKDCAGAKPICSQINECVACPDNQTCKTATSDARPVCSMSGAQMGACLECGKDADCSADPNKPFCSPTGTCVGCDPTAMGACAARSPGKPVCSASGACVQCVKNLDCDSKTPVCSPNNSCGPCSGDSDCAGRYGPVICMTKDGHCAVDDETIYVQQSAACVSGSGPGGTPMAPYCDLSMVPSVVSSSRNLVVVRGAVNNSAMSFGANAQRLFIVGQKSALIGGVNTGVRVTAGEATIRDVTIST